MAAKSIANGFWMRLPRYERSLVTPNGRFDRYLRGEPGAIAADEERGYRLFKSYGCIACHQGVNVGGNLFQQFGIFHDPLSAAPSPPRPISAASRLPETQPTATYSVCRVAQRGTDRALFP